jgi:hypothetical protein
MGNPQGPELARTQPILTASKTAWAPLASDLWFPEYKKSLEFYQMKVVWFSEQAELKLTVIQEQAGNEHKSGSKPVDKTASAKKLR